MSIEKDTGGGSSGAATDLSNLTSPTDINQDLLPDGNNTRKIGSTSLQWDEVVTRVLTFVGGQIIMKSGALADRLKIIIDQNTPTGVNVDAVIQSQNAANKGIALTSENGSSVTGPVHIESGNASAGNSGDIIQQTGTATGTRGKITQDAASIDQTQTVSTNVVWENGVTGSRPGSPTTGQRYFDTTIGLPIWYDGTNWIDAAGTTV